MNLNCYQDQKNIIFQLSFRIDSIGAKSCLLASEMSMQIIPKNTERKTLDDDALALFVSELAAIKQASFISRAHDGLLIEVNQA